MKLTFGILLSILGVLPLLVASNPLNSRATDGVWVCPEANWGGVCTWTQVTPGTSNCTIINPEWKAWSIGPDKDVVCNVYQDSNCPIGLDPNVHIKYYSTYLPGNASVVGPAAQDGQGAANVTTYKAYQCWPKVGKRSIDTDMEADTNSMTNIPTIEDPQDKTRTVEPRGDHILYICSEPKYHGTCEWVPITAKDELHALCLPLPYPRSSSISFGPDEGVTCKVYNWSCYDDADSHDTTVIQYPGSDQMFKASETQDSGATTWKCWLTKG